MTAMDRDATAARGRRHTHQVYLSYRTCIGTYMHKSFLSLPILSPPGVFAAFSFFFATLGCFPLGRRRHHHYYCCCIPQHTYLPESGGILSLPPPLSSSSFPPKSPKRRKGDGRTDSCLFCSLPLLQAGLGWVGCTINTLRLRRPINRLPTYLD